MNAKMIHNDNAIRIINDKSVVGVFNIPDTCEHIYIKNCPNLVGISGHFPKSVVIIGCNKFDSVFNIHPRCDTIKLANMRNILKVNGCARKTLLINLGIRGVFTVQEHCERFDLSKCNLLTNVICLSNKVKEYLLPNNMIRLNISNINKISDAIITNEEIIQDAIHSELEIQKDITTEWRKNEENVIILDYAIMYSILKHKVNMYYKWIIIDGVRYRIIWKIDINHTNEYDPIKYNGINKMIVMTESKPTYYNNFTTTGLNIIKQDEHNDMILTIPMNTTAIVFHGNTINKITGSAKYVSIDADLKIRNDEEKFVMSVPDACIRFLYIKSSNATEFDTNSLKQGPTKLIITNNNIRQIAVPIGTKLINMSHCYELNYIIGGAQYMDLSYSALSGILFIPNECTQLYNIEGTGVDTLYCETIHASGPNYINISKTYISSFTVPNKCKILIANNIHSSSFSVVLRTDKLNRYEFIDMISYNMNHIVKINNVSNLDTLSTILNKVCESYIYTSRSRLFYDDMNIISKPLLLNYGKLLSGLPHFNYLLHFDLNVSSTKSITRYKLNMFDYDDSTDRSEIDMFYESLNLSRSSIGFELEPLGLSEIGDFDPSELKTQMDTLCETDMTINNLSYVREYTLF